MTSRFTFFPMDAWVHGAPAQAIDQDQRRRQRRPGVTGPDTGLSSMLMAAALDRLQEQPELLRLEPGLAPTLFFYRVRKHFLVCDYHADTVCVLTIIHSSMDIPARLAELKPQLSAEVRLLHEKLAKKAREKS